MEEEKIKHLEFIQAVITRMNSNSFQIKNWMITIVSALLALYANSGNIAYVYVAIIPTLIFWFLDAYYLQQERKFRKLYNAIIDNHDIQSFKMPIENFKVCYVKVLFSKTIFLLYFFVILGIIIFALCCNS